MASIHTPPQTKHKKQDFSPGYVALMTTSPANRVISSRRIIVWLARRTIRHLHYQWCVTIGLLFCLLSLAGVAISPLWRHPTTSQAWPPSSRPTLPPQTPPAKTSQNIFRTLPQTIADIKISVKKWTGICMHNLKFQRIEYFYSKRRNFQNTKFWGFWFFGNDLIKVWSSHHSWLHEDEY